MREDNEKKFFRFIKDYKRPLFLIFFGFILNLACWAALYLIVGIEQKTVILHYNAFLGIDDIDFNFEKNYINLFKAPAGGFLVWLLNSSIGLYFYRIGRFSKTKKPLKELLLGSYFLFWSGLLLQAIIAIYCVAIIIVNNR